MKKDFYTYAYLRKDGTPYYIGKGRRGRCFDNTRRRYKCPNDRKRVLILKKNLTNDEAIKHEIYMIAVLGRKDLGTGILRNRTDGGEGTIGYIFTDEHRANLTKSALKKPPKSKLTRKRQSDAMKGKPKSKEHAAANGAAHARPITLIHTITKEIKTFKSGKEAATVLGLNPSSVAALRKKKLMTTGQWRLL